MMMVKTEMVSSNMLISSSGSGVCLGNLIITSHLIYMSLITALQGCYNLVAVPKYANFNSILQIFLNSLLIIIRIIVL